MENSTKTFGVLCLSSATGLFLYWTMFMTSNFLRMTRFGLNIQGIYASTGLIGAVCVALFTIGIISVRAKPVETLVLVRNTEGRVTSIHQAEYKRVTRLWARATTPKVKPNLETLQPRKHDKVKYALGIAVLTALIGGYASAAHMMGYTIQDMMNGMYSPFMTVSSQSMQPALNNGDLIVVAREKTENIGLGDIIAFNVPSPYDKLAPSPTVHRVVEKWTENGEIYFKTRGDDNSNADSWNVPAENVVGKYAHFKIPYVGFIFMFLRTPLGLASVALTLALSFLYDYYRKNGRHES